MPERIEQRVVGGHDAKPRRVRREKRAQLIGATALRVALERRVIDADDAQLRVSRAQRRELGELGVAVLAPRRERDHERRAGRVAEHRAIEIARGFELGERGEAAGAAAGGGVDAHAASATTSNARVTA